MNVFLKWIFGGTHFHAGEGQRLWRPKKPGETGQASVLYLDYRARRSRVCILTKAFVTPSLFPCHCHPSAPSLISLLPPIKALSISRRSYHVHHFTCIISFNHHKKILGSRYYNFTLWMMQKEYAICTKIIKLIECTTRIYNCTWQTLNQGFSPISRMAFIKNYLIEGWKRGLEFNQLGY